MVTFGKRKMWMSGEKVSWWLETAVEEVEQIIIFAYSFEDALRKFVTTIDGLLVLVEWFLDDEFVGRDDSIRFRNTALGLLRRFTYNLFTYKMRITSVKFAE